MEGGEGGGQQGLTRPMCRTAAESDVMVWGWGLGFGVWGSCSMVLEFRV